MIDYFENGLLFFCQDSQRELATISVFHFETEKTWKEKNSSLAESLNAILEKYPEEHHEEIVIDHAEDFHLTQTKYPSLHREAILITIYNFLENDLNKLCSQLQETVGFSLKLKDLHGSGIERAFLYLEKVSSFSFENMETEIGYIKNINKIRNIIVHSGGYLAKETNRSTLEFIKQNRYLSGGPDCYIDIESGFIDELIGNLIEFYEKLQFEIEKFIDRHP
ncbi:hypothetical protein MHL40_21420 [Pseudomonas luteola]|uniref:hypothetical protein n=1 Tax=Pseudomonas luteola TaxID=47886 RepID=UPI001EF4128A|nr:hypothetical protein [Pseudomonas luteola]MCG7375213.1 hypothetical protein [Pseudomonas luteola]